MATPVTPMDTMEEVLASAVAPATVSHAYKQVEDELASLRPSDVGTNAPVSEVELVIQKCASGQESGCNAVIEVLWTWYRVQPLNPKLLKVLEDTVGLAKAALSPADFATLSAEAEKLPAVSASPSH
jgi:hypothetical protein